MRSIQHPGPIDPQRVAVAPATATAVELTLPAGGTLLAALTHGLARALAPHASAQVSAQVSADASAHASADGVASAVLTLRGGALWPFAYVMPALSASPDHAVYFSDRFEASGPVQLVVATVTYGVKNGQPMLHCHARWTDADGTPRCGHVLPDQAWVSEPIQASACLLDGARFEVQPDSETAFALFKPAAAPARSAAAPNGWLVRISPNEDVCTALETVCRQHGLAAATVRGGVGSTVGARFEDGGCVEPFVTELLVRNGVVRPDGTGALRAEIDVSLVDHTGALAQGRLQRGANPVLVTFELVLVAH